MIIIDFGSHDGLDEATFMEMNLLKKYGEAGNVENIFVG